MTVPTLPPEQAIKRLEAVQQMLGESVVVLRAAIDPNRRLDAATEKVWLGVTREQVIRQVEDLRVYMRRQQETIESLRDQLSAKIARVSELEMEISNGRYDPPTEVEKRERADWHEVADRKAREAEVYADRLRAAGLSTEITVEELGG